MVKMVSPVWCLLSVLQTSASPTADCLVVKKLYHKATRSCLTPFMQGPCPQGEWLVLEDVSGTGVCRPQTTCTDGRIPVLDQAEGTVCGCPPGREEVAGSCELLFSQSVCKEGQVLLPETQAVGSKTCSAGFSCRQAKDCEAFTVAKEHGEEKDNSDF